MRVWDHDTGEVICGRCGEVIKVEPVLVPKIRHNEKLQSYLKPDEAEHRHITA